MKPYAVCLLERFRAGETASELAAIEGIPLERIQTRLDAAVRLERMPNADRNDAIDRRAA
jgi:hypothetical protein